jgi:hypothetical protein
MTDHFQRDPIGHATLGPKIRIKNGPGARGSYRGRSMAAATRRGIIRHRTIYERNRLIVSIGQGGC